jgi:twitching motility two-component system response regulator PilH
MAQETILLVEDSPTERRLVSAALQRGGYRVITASDGEEAVAKAGSELPQLIVLDIILPKMNGYQVCRKLKGNEDTQDIKILMLSSKSQESDRFWGLKQGADDYLTKPFVEDELLEAVGALL